MTQPTPNSSENDTPIFEYARHQEKSTYIINWLLERQLAKPVYQESMENPVAAIIPLGKGKSDGVEKALIYGKDNSLVKVVLDGNTKPIIEPNSQDLIVLPIEVYGGIANNAADKVSEAIRDNPWQFFNVSADAEHEPDEVLPDFNQFFSDHKD